MQPEDAWVPTYSGKKFYPLAPTVNDIYIEDIAHALSHICRYVGHSRFHYSVARHSIEVSKMVPGPLRMCALLHDASEAYLSDISRDVKRTAGFETYRQWEQRLEDVIAQKFYLPYPMPDEVKAADAAILPREAAWLFDPGSPLRTQWGVLRREDYQRIYVELPGEAEKGFLELYEELRKGDV